jgi:hypothetical protein
LRSEGVIGDVHLEVFFDLVTVPHRADGKTDLTFTLERARVNAALDLTQLFLGAREQFTARAGTVGRDQRVAAHDQPLAGIQLLAGDLGQVDLVEHRQLQAAFLDQLSHLRRLERGDERELGRVRDEGHVVFGADPAVGHHDHPGEPEPLLELVHLRGQRLVILHIALERLDRHRPPVCVTQQPVLDLHPPALAIAVVIAEARQRAGAPLKVRGGDVI